MSIFVRIWLALATVLLIGSLLLLNTLQRQIKPNMRQVVEDTLADNAQIIAALVADDVAAGRINQAAFDREIQATLKRPLHAKIWLMTKNDVQQQLYITNAQGIVLYDSTGQHRGDDFSRWNDVYRTLRGQYGARSTRSDPNDDTSSTMYVAAPVVWRGQLLGVVSVGKAGRAVQPYIDQAQHDMLTSAAAMLLISLLLGALIALWLRHSINQVRRYALALAPLGQPAPHFFSARELNDLTQAVEQMRNQLEDRAYVEQYIHTLTHELKSPLTAISASAELLQDDLPRADQHRFARNISQQTERLHHLIERLLVLARLEQRHDEFVRQPVDLVAIINTLMEQRHSLIVSKQLVVGNTLPQTLALHAEPFWLAQALGNVLDNAIDFCPQGGQLRLSVLADTAGIQLCIDNEGATIPDYALPQVFDRYYSLPRPNGRKGTGIGLTLVKEVMTRHQGRIDVCNVANGVRVVLVF
ncbi:MAG: hypothetical protein RLY58_405 [Pseudomonadota bacterium]|jgi:two-component system sensor histidine kinase CreC